MTIEELTTLDKLNKAFYEYEKRTSWKQSVQSYKSNLLINNIKLQEDIRSGRYKVSETNKFTISERGKVRDIEAPAIRDRIIQKVLCEYVLIPNLSKCLIYDNYASLKHRGTAFARKRLDILLHEFIGQYGEDGYILKIDIRRYFDNIDHAVLKKMLRNKIHESEEIMNLIDYIIDTSSDSDIGLNLGAEAPQIFAIYYLSVLDTYVKTVRSVKFYGRYMDDIFIIGKTKEELRELLMDIQKVLLDIKLYINEKKTQIIKLTHGFTFMQIKYSVRNGKVIKRPSYKKVVRERKRIKHFSKDPELDDLYVYNCYNSWRNGVVKDHNRCDKIIKSLDNLYNKLNPNRIEIIKETRDDIFNQIIRENRDIKEVFYF